MYPGICNTDVFMDMWSMLCYNMYTILMSDIKKKTKTFFVDYIELFPLGYVIIQK